MSPSIGAIPRPISSRVRKVAQVIRLFSDEEIEQLIDLAPKLEHAQRLPSVRESALSYFYSQLASTPFTDNDQFIGGLTYHDYLAMSATEEEAFWER